MVLVPAPSPRKVLRDVDDALKNFVPPQKIQLSRLGAVAMFTSVKVEVAVVDVAVKLVPVIAPAFVRAKPPPLMADVHGVCEPPAGVAHVPSPRQKVDADAPVPLFKLATGRLPVTSDARFTRAVATAPAVALRNPESEPSEKFDAKRFVDEAVVAKNLVDVA